ncbi:MAG: hypothetical protein HC886_19115 [Leptolyngbyaceae cyanobacterium SM1_1_3]|nr:hypothetical protein [Leptolyngbyaceae cyanobacterium SM1_1_3]
MPQVCFCLPGRCLLLLLLPGELRLGLLIGLEAGTIFIFLLLQMLELLIADCDRLGLSQNIR